MMRLTPSVTPVAMFERTLGSSTRRIVAIRVLPSAKAASRMCAGHRPQPVAGGDEQRRQRDQRHHRAGGDERAAVDAAAFGAERQRREDAELEDRQRRTARARCPACPRRSRCSTRRSARASDASARPARTRRPRSRSRRASGKASAMPITVSSSVPIRGSRMPPVCACEVLIAGRVTQQARGAGTRSRDSPCRSRSPRRSRTARAPPSTRTAAPAGRPSARSSGEERRPRSRSCGRRCAALRASGRERAHPRTWYLRSGNLIR